MPDDEAHAAVEAFIKKYAKAPKRKAEART
jgi:hypothetical protein